MAKRSPKQRANDKRLGRMAKLRSKSGSKRRSKPKKSKSNKARRRSRSMVKKHYSKRARAAGGIKNFTKGFLGGNGAGELADELVTFVSVDPRIKIPVKILASTLGAYYTGGKQGLVGGLAAAGLDIGLSLMNGKDFFNTGAAGQSRL